MATVLSSVLALVILTVCCISKSKATGPCRDLKSYCKLVTQNQCTSSSWTSVYVRKDCPLTCKQCVRSTVRPPRLCGVSSPLTSRIASGTIAKRGAWPWIVRVKSIRKMNPRLISVGNCGGTLITPSWVLTSAHCLTRPHPDRIVVYLGDHNTSTVDAGEHQVEANYTVVHGNYSYTTKTSDIALIKLRKPVPITRTIVPACLPGKQQTIDASDNCFMTGWGELQEFQGTTTILRQGKIIPSKCRRDKTICGFVSGNDTAVACSGDSGGPLVCQDRTTKSWTLQGVVMSSGYGCTGFTLFVSVKEYLDWIQSYVGQIV